MLPILAVFHEESAGVSSKSLTIYDQQVYYDANLVQNGDTNRPDCCGATDLPTSREDVRALIFGCCRPNKWDLWSLGHCRALGR